MPSSVVLFSSHCQSTVILASSGELLAAGMLRRRRVKRLSFGHFLLLIII